MKTRKQMLSELIEALENDKVRLEVLKDYRQFVYDNDEKLKGNAEALKELNANKFSLENTEKMMTWMNNELIKE
jgi:hypothetical protein